MSEIMLTDRASQRIHHIMATEPSGSMLRITVEGGGCSGFQYKFSIDQTRIADDIAIENSGAIVVIDPVSHTLIQGSTIDFIDDLMGQSFKITNPQATASCGCGTSFSL